MASNRRRRTADGGRTSVTVMSLRLLEGRRPLLVDVVVAVALTAFTQYEVWTNDGVAAPLAAQAVCFAAATLSLTARRHAPLLGLAVLAAALVAVPVVDAETRSAADAIGNAAVFGLLWGAGRLVRRLGQRGASWERKAQDLEAEREEQLRIAIAAERQRIARELHDVVAHSVGVMVLQAGAARQHLALDPDRARQPLLVVEDVGREAMEELHRLLQVLRRADEGQAPLAGLGNLDQLVQQVRQAGLDVRLHVDGAPQQLAPGLDLTAYRVLQEALTNVLRHAPSARTRVEIVYADRELILSVVDEGPRSAPHQRDSSGGHGLIGMRERVLLYSGCLKTGPREQGGFAVRARLPLVAAVTGA